MATAIKTIVVEAKCDVCGKVYQGEDSMAEAMRCERHGLPTPKFAVGTAFKLRQPSGFTSTYTVIKHVPGWYQHRACYVMQTQSGYETVLNEHKLGYHLQNSIV